MLSRLATVCLFALAACAGKDSGNDSGKEPAKRMTREPDPVPAPAAATRPSVTKSEEEWRRQLTAEQFRVLRRAGTEAPFGKAYQEFHDQGGGTYFCAGCDTELFASKQKFDSQCGWPSFYDPANAQNVRLLEDRSGGMVRTEVRCAVCDGHLGHVFRGEGFATPTDTRYCINGVALKFVPDAPPGEKR